MLFSKVVVFVKMVMSSHQIAARDILPTVCHNLDGVYYVTAFENQG